MLGRAPQGLHHVTCVCNDWARTVAFYESLGFHLVKNTVNHDAPDTRHIYLADTTGTPGSTITFFEWPSERRGRPGLDSAQHVGLSLPSGLTLDDVEATLREAGSSVTRTTEDARACLETRDPDGLALRLYAGAADGPRLHHVGLYGALDARRSFFRDVLGFDVKTAVDDTGSASEGVPARVLGRGDALALTLLPGDPGPGRIAPGAVHHVAFAMEPDDQEAILAALRERDVRTSDLVDRVYFRSLYLRDPAGHILEFATPGPGFDVDEPADALGQTLVLPAWLEDQREKIEAALQRRASGGS